MDGVLSEPDWRRLTPICPHASHFTRTSRTIFLMRAELSPAALGHAIVAGNAHQRPLHEAGGHTDTGGNLNELS